MQIKTIKGSPNQSDSFDRQVNKLLSEGWDIHDLKVGGGGSSSYWYYVAFLVKD